MAKQIQQVEIQRSERVFKADKPLFWVAWGDVVHFGKLEAGEELWTGQSSVMYFENEQEWIDKCLKLGVDPFQTELEPMQAVAEPVVEPTLEERIITLEIETKKLKETSTVIAQTLNISSHEAFTG